MPTMPIQTRLACLVLATAFCAAPVAAPAASAPQVRCELTLPGDRTAFHADERIELKLAFIADEPGYVVNTTLFTGPSPTDTVLLTPGEDIYAWSADLGRFALYTNDAVTLSELVAQTPVEVPILLNDNYRFDAPGHYRVLVTSRRVRAGRPHGISSLDEDTPPLVLTCNDVSFEILPGGESAEQAQVVSIMQRIRAANDANAAQAIIWQELDYLSGDSATAAKIALFLNPVITGDLTTHTTRGLWLARNRTMVVAALEKALVDPAQRNDIGMNLLGTLAALKASLEIPLATSPSAPQQQASPLVRVAIERLSAQYAHQLAQTIPRRSGEAGIDAARTVFAYLVGAHQAVGPEFDMARNYLISNFAQIDPHEVEWLLGGYGAYLRDARLVPVLQRIVEDASQAALRSLRAAAARQLALIDAGATGSSHTQ